MKKYVLLIFMLVFCLIGSVSSVFASTIPQPDNSILGADYQIDIVQYNSDMSGFSYVWGIYRSNDDGTFRFNAVGSNQPFSLIDPYSEGINYYIDGSVTPFQIWSKWSTSYVDFLAGTYSLESGAYLVSGSYLPTGFTPLGIIGTNNSSIQSFTDSLLDSSSFQPVLDNIYNNIVSIIPFAIAILAIIYGLRFIIRSFHLLG